jgi:stearoyl-CoA desaturase (delta-9 desaturase)
MALWQLVGFPDWTIVHVLHHMHADDTVLDPHPPMNKSYWQFLLEMRQTVSMVFANYYFHLWGKNEETLKNLKELGMESKMATFLKIVFWYLVLGPQIFAFFFVFSVVFKMMHYAWFNYATHVYSKDGVLIVNLDKGLYKFINFVAFGLYYHKNHHLRPDLFDPSKFSQENVMVFSD